MTTIYAMSDIHGQMEVFREMLELVDLSQPENKLILLGDYIDHNQQRTDAFREIMELQQAHPGQIICLMGNHEAYFLGDCGVEPFCEPQFALDEDFDIANEDSLFPLELLLQSDEEDGRPIVFEDKEVLSWLKKLPLYHETDTQIFVHAGIDEDAGEHWKFGVEDNYFYEKFPPTQGKFQKDIIAGHAGVHCYELANDPDFHEVFWDGASHFYLDGATEFSGKLPLLKYCAETGKYTTFARDADGKWHEAMISIPKFCK